jgi:hypothetical protein
LPLYFHAVQIQPTKSPPAQRICFVTIVFAHIPEFLKPSNTLCGCGVYGGRLQNFFRAAKMFLPKTPDKLHGM